MVSRVLNYIRKLLGLLILSMYLYDIKLLNLLISELLGHNNLTIWLVMKFPLWHFMIIFGLRLNMESVLLSMPYIIMCLALRLIFEMILLSKTFFTNYFIQQLTFCR